MSGAHNPQTPTSPRLAGKHPFPHTSFQQQQHPQHSSQQQLPHHQHHHSWDEETVSGGKTRSGGRGATKAPTRASSSPLPPPTYKCPKSPRTLRSQASVVHSYDSSPPVQTPKQPRSLSSRSMYSPHGVYTDASNSSGGGGGGAMGRFAGGGRHGEPPRSPKITTTYANDNGDDGASISSASFYQTPTSGGSRSPMGGIPSSSQDNSFGSYGSPSSGSGSVFFAGASHRSPQRSCKFVFDAISPSAEDIAPGNSQESGGSISGRKFEYYEPLTPDDELQHHQHYESPRSPKIFEPRRQNSKKRLCAAVLPSQDVNVPRIFSDGSELHSSNSVSATVKSDEWEMPLVGGNVNSSIGGGGGSGANFYLKRDSCVTESTQISVGSSETNNSNTTAATTTTSFTYSDRSKTAATPFECGNNSKRTGGCGTNCEMEPSWQRQRRHAINITSNPGYQTLHGSHTTLDRTCSDTIVSLRSRKSTGDLTQDVDGGNASRSTGNKPAIGGLDGGSHKPRRRGSSKGGLAYLASRRSSRESMKSACSNASIFSNDDIGPLAFQSSTRGKQRRTSNFLELPVPDHIRPRVCSLPDRPYNPRMSDDLYRLRHFSISKGNVVNCGDSIISRRSRSNTSVNSTNSRASERSPFEGSCCGGGGYANVDSLPVSPDDDSEPLEPPPPPRYRIVMLGDAGVGKTALVNQFMTSEYMHTYDASLDDEFGEKTVSVLLDDEESELIFIDHPSVEMSVENCLSTYEPHGCVVVFSVVEKTSFRVAEEIVNYLWQENYTQDKAVILVGNKADLARARVISSQDGKALAASRDSKFIETSSGIQHNVDELLVGILKQMRLKETREKKATSSKMKTSRTHISLHLAKEILQKICLSDISKSKSCENLHVL